MLVNSTLLPPLLQPWTDITKEKLKRYIGLVMMMGFIQKMAGFHLTGAVTTG